MKKIVVVINSNTNRQSAKKNIRFEHELLMEIEAVKPNGMSFSQWVKEACREKIYQTNQNTDECAQLPTYENSPVRTPDQNLGRTSFPEVEESVEVLAKSWHSQGMYYQQIADRLNELGKLNSDEKPWSRVSVRQKLNQG